MMNELKVQLESHQDLAYLHSEIHSHLSTAHTAILANKKPSDDTNATANHVDNASSGDGKKRGAVFVAPASTEEDIHTVCPPLLSRVVCRQSIWHRQGKCPN